VSKIIGCICQISPNFSSLPVPCPTAGGPARRQAGGRQDCLVKNTLLQKSIADFGLYKGFISDKLYSISWKIIKEIGE